MLNMLEFLTLNLSKMLAACHSKIVNSFKIIDSLMVAVRFFIFRKKVWFQTILRFFSNIFSTYILLTFSEHHHFVAHYRSTGGDSIWFLCAHLFILFSSNVDKGGTALNISLTITSSTSSWNTTVHRKISCKGGSWFWTRKIE